MQSFPSVSLTLNTDTDKYFATAYQFTMALSVTNSVETLLDIIAKTLAVLNGSFVIVLKGHGGSYSRGVRATSSPESIATLHLIRSKSPAYFQSTDEKGQLYGWVPLSAETWDGGIYVLRRPNESPFTEREIELLTMLGTIATNALRRLETGGAQAVEPLEVAEFHGIVGASKLMKDLYNQIRLAAANIATVLIEGESGTGKELVARAIHETGPRAKGPFIAIDCGAIPETLIEAELFGSKRGAYTGAVADRPGLFEAAHHGTIFLDEISNTTMALQVKLLRVIQEREIRRIGETKGRVIDVRLIVATNQNLEVLANAGQFRKDLLFRLNVLHVKRPPL